MSEFFFNKVAGLKEALAQMFSCKFCEIFQNSLFYRIPPVAASGKSTKPCTRKMIEKEIEQE